MQIGAHLTTHRKAKNNMSQRALVTIAGVSYSTISRIEKEQVMPNALTLIKLADALNVPVQTIIDAEREYVANNTN